LWSKYSKARDLIQLGHWRNRYEGRAENLSTW
jgi:hypothetical protein